MGFSTNLQYRNLYKFFILNKNMIKKEGVKQKKLTKAELEKVLIDNFVNLQKVLTNLSIKFDTLSDNISKLLNLFEISAKSFIKKQEEGGEDDTIKKLDTLLDQNKIIAKGLTLIEEKSRPGFLSEEHERPRPLPKY